MTTLQLEDLKTLQHAWAYGFSYRKFKILQTFFPQCHIHHVSDCAALPIGSPIFIWGAQVIADPSVSDRFQWIRVEDGFLRSVGLGAALHPPVSWVFDTQGIYFDSRQASSLELILNNTVFDPILLQRAAHIHQRISQQRISKYNLNQTTDVEFPVVTAQRKVLVIGQVEGDASIRYGSPNIKLNQDFLSKVRLNKPNEYIVYRPHPDVTQGWRKDSLNLYEARELMDLMSTEGDIVDWLDWADEVHVMTSLTGFEALLRQKKVYCYGLPFYAGWGLTHDFMTSPRPKRNLSLNELIAGSLILYPSYRSILKNTHPALNIEQALDELLQLRQQNNQSAWRWLQPILKYLNLRREL